MDDDEVAGLFLNIAAGVLTRDEVAELLRRNVAEKDS
jgi:hypothetical protein